MAHDYPAGENPPPTDFEWYRRVTDSIHATTRSIIEHGCAAEVRPVLEQVELFAS